LSEYQGLTKAAMVIKVV